MKNNFNSILSVPGTHFNTQVSEPTLKRNNTAVPSKGSHCLTHSCLILNVCKTVGIYFSIIKINTHKPFPLNPHLKGK